MRKAILVVTCLVICVSLLAAVTEQPLNVKTGNWQVEMTFDYSGLPPNMQAMLNQMTTQQRAAAGLGGTKAYKHCVAAKQLNTPWMQGDNNCNWTVLKSTNNDLEVRGTSCQEGRSYGVNTSVEIRIHAIDPEHVRATMHGTGTGNGVNATLDGSYTGTWLGATCPANSH